MISDVCRWATNQFVRQRDPHHYGLPPSLSGLDLNVLDFKYSQLFAFEWIPMDSNGQVFSTDRGTRVPNIVP